MVSLGATALTVATMFILDTEPNSDVVWFTFFSTLFVYNLSLVLGNRKLKNANSPVRRHQWLLKHDLLLTVMGLLSVPAIAYIALFRLNINSLLFLLPFGIVAAAYSIPIKFGGKTYVLRESGISKIFLITLMWGVTTALLPVVEIEGLGSLLEWDTIFLFITRMAFVFAITIPFDIRDLRYDKETGVNTIPRLIGERNAKLLSVVLLVLFIGLCVPFIKNDPYTIAIFSGLCISFISTLAIILLCNKDRPEYYFSFLIEGTSFLQLVFIILALFFL